MVMKILLHTCCAPCTIYPLNFLRGEGHDVTGYFYNPNIHPYTEFRQRKETLASFAGEENLALIMDDKYGLDDFLNLTWPVCKNSAGTEERCAYCYRLRLASTAAKGVETGADAFSTTLLVSPWQKHDLIRQIGEEIGKEKEIPFYYNDFRPGFRDAQKQARERGLYRQKYCGCIFSEKERYKQ